MFVFVFVFVSVCAHVFVSEGVRSSVGSVVFSMMSNCWNYSNDYKTQLRIIYTISLLHRNKHNRRKWVYDTTTNAPTEFE